MAKSSTKSAKADKKQVKSKKQVKKQESSSESSSSSSSESESSSSSESDSDSSDEEKEEEKKVSSDSDSSSDSESEAEVKKEKKDDSSDSDSDSSSSDSDSSDEEEAPKKEAKKDTKKVAKKEVKKEASSSSSSSSSESDSDSSSSSSSSSDSDSDSDSDSEEEEKDSKKRKVEESSEEVEESTEEPVSKKPKTNEEPATLFVGRLSWSIDDEWLRREFEPVGGVISARVIMERSTGKSRGYGYVDFDSKSAAEKALQEYQGKELDGRPINLDMSTGKPHASNPNTDRAKQFGDVPSAPSDTLFVGNLSFNAERDSLFNTFGEYGTVVSCRIPTHPDTQQPKGFGYVQFSSVDEAKAALEALNGEYLDGRACRLDFSTPRDNSNAPRGGFGGNRGGRGDFGGNRGGRGGFGGRGDFGGRGGFGGRERSAPPRSAPNSAEFKGTKKTFD
ncbi:DEHA2A13134p [Debaryomyces hansenii CBS767]|jgi:nucleolin|uniref:DEHA2A13134p n=1 Tax=Debaryomyces hansenii (strain ATCC 36239 / CBS 767 / BCRC 21394 / JCM 1990 / NBRC 0083 / IGC 2968) TaxID=284592 RepID=Q6BY19_DEBHA|nr:DEHA2A13134p [Debaryomyces hansenii CBS767]CAG84877.1 DEHA2A13134p [Debaryomyces hansenii CBS767]|eukprot:XP_456900.1 DEHA2A13134p [Debaryomyces hansenii CBS767]